MTDSGTAIDAKNTAGGIYCADYRVYSSYTAQLPGGCLGPDFEVSRQEYLRLQSSDVSRQALREIPETYCAELLSHNAYKVRRGFPCHDGDVEINKSRFQEISALTVTFCRNAETGGIYKSKADCRPKDRWISLGDFRAAMEHSLFISCVDVDTRKVYLTIGACFIGDRVSKDPAIWPLLHCKSSDSNYIYSMRAAKCPASFRMADAAFAFAGYELDRLDRDEDSYVSSQDIAAYDCPLPRRKSGTRLVLRFQDGAKASVAFEGVTIAGARDPIVRYTYWSESRVIKLSPDDEGSREIGLLEFSKVPKILTIKGRAKIRCRRFENPRQS